MSKAIKISIILFVLLVFIFIGIPLQPEGSDPNFEVNHPNVTQRCNTIGDFNSYLSCSATNPQLKGATLIGTVRRHIDQTTRPFGLFFFITLALFLMVVCILL